MALSSALGLSEATQNDRFAVAAATLSLIAGAAEEMPVLVLVDDAHWLDDASRDALLFAARRLAVDPVAFLFATRPRASAARGSRRSELAGLDRASGSADHRSAGSPVAAAVLDSLLEATAGNPLGLIEIPAGLSEDQLAGREPILPPMLGGGAVERAFAGRLAALSEEARATAAVLAGSDGGAATPVRAALAELSCRSRRSPSARTPAS